MFKYKNQGFTFIELLLAVLILGILASFIMANLRPSQRLANQRDVQRKADLVSILSAIKQYSIDNNGSLPTGIQLNANCSTAITFAQICKTGTAQLTCVASNAVSLSVLTDNSKYLVTMPVDPKNVSIYGTGYNVVKDANNRVTVCAPLTEATTTVISFIR